MSGAGTAAGSPARKTADSRRHLLRVDWVGGLLVGVAMLAARDWLAALYGLPADLLLLMGAANLVYASYSFSLARRRRRPLALVGLLAAANVAWGLACVRWAVVHAGSATLLGLVHLVAEAAYVAGLGCLEWRWRALLRDRPSASRDAPAP